MSQRGELGQEGDANTDGIMHLFPTNCRQSTSEFAINHDGDAGRLDGEHRLGQSSDPLLGGSSLVSRAEDSEGENA